MANNGCQYSYAFGFGPHWDQLFVQSNFGIVTRAGMWLMPEPEATKRVKINLPNFEDLGWFIDLMAKLRLRGVFEQPLVCGSYLREAMVFSRRRDWQAGQGPITAEVEKRIRDRFKVGCWSANLTLFGYPAVLDAQAELLRSSLEPRLKERLQCEDWRRGDPIEKSGAGAPDFVSLQIVNWLGGRGGHIGFSPVLPTDGGRAVQHARALRERFDEFGFDYYSSFTLFNRHVKNVNLVIFDRDNADMVERARNLMFTITTDAARRGFGEYRAHIDFMQLVSGTYDFNDHALNRLNQRTKDFIDPNGVIAPGKNGIWPAAYRGTGNGAGSL
jgi:4-cresol dehydrogenase (hydroxylating) flavoprotein subunit